MTTSTKLTLTLGVLCCLADVASAQAPRRGHEPQPGTPKSSWVKPKAITPRPGSVQNHSGGTASNQQNLLVASNDECTTAMPIAGPGPHPYDNTLATTGTTGQAEAVCLFFGSTAVVSDVWFVWTAGFTGTARFENCLDAIDTKVIVYSSAACPPVAGSVLSCNDDVCNLQSTTDFPATAGQSYLIQLGLSGAPVGGPGTGMFTITQLLTPSNDECAASSALVGAGPWPFDNTNATTSAQGQAEALCNHYGDTSMRRDVWYTWTATFTGSARATFCGANVDTKVAVYAGAGCPAASALACDDDFCNGPGWESGPVFAAVTGQQYTIQIGVYPFPAGVGAPGGAGVFDIVNISLAPNDECTAPTAIAGAGPHPYDNGSATTGTVGQTEAGCLFFGSTSVTYDVWFVWTAGFTGTARLENCSDAIDTKAIVYAGSSCPTAGSALACNDDQCNFQTTVDFPVVAGQDYLIQFGCSGSPTTAPGIGQFTITPFIALPNDDCASATLISGPGPHAFDSTLATTGAQGQANGRCFIFGATGIAYDLWYTWTAPSTGWFALNLCTGGAHDSKVAVYSGAGCPAAEPLDCDDDACGTVGGPSQGRFFATAGAQYTFQLGSYPFGAPGAAGSFTVDPFTPVSNDDCNAALALPGPGIYGFDLTNAISGFEGQNEALCVPTSGTTYFDYDVWYTFIPPCTGTYTVRTCGLTTLDTKIGVYLGGGCPLASVLACGDQGCTPVGNQTEVTFVGAAGLPCTIQLGVWPGEVPGAGMFEITAPCSPAAGTPYCFGDGTGTTCPCGNAGAAGNGCGSSVNAAGGTLAATGVPSVTSDSVVLAGTGMPNSSALYFQGTAPLNGGAGVAFGDGLRCVGGTVIRLGTKSNVAGASQYPAAGDPSVSVRGLIPVAGGTRDYQCWYRNAAAFCTASTFNLTNAVEISWGP